MDIYLKSKGSFKKSKMYFVNAKIVAKINDKKLIKIAEDTVEKLKKDSPYESIAEGWEYEIIQTKTGFKLCFNNLKVENGVNIALIVDTGHIANGGKWISGRNYIKGPVEEAYNKIINETWEELNSF